MLCVAGLLQGKVGQKSILKTPTVLFLKFIVLGKKNCMCDKRYYTRASKATARMVDFFR